MADIPPSFRLSVPDDFGVDVTEDGGDVVVAVRGEAPERQVVVRGANTHARKVLEITGLDQVFHVEP